MHRPVLLTLGLPLVSVVFLMLGPEPHATADAAHEAPRLLERLGDRHHPIKTSSKQAQAYFDQGMALNFGFNHDAAVRSFEAAARIDPDCAICYWGVALALGPNINAPMGPEAGKAAFVAVQQAQALAPEASERERAYIAALAARYTAEPPEDRSALDLAYAQAMKRVYEADRSDLDAATLYAEALMDLYPWAYWTDDAEPREHPAEIMRVIDRMVRGFGERRRAYLLYE